MNSLSGFRGRWGKAAPTGLEGKLRALEATIRTSRPGRWSQELRMAPGASVQSIPWPGLDLGILLCARPSLHPASLAVRPSACPPVRRAGSEPGAGSRAGLSEQLAPSTRIYRLGSAGQDCQLCLWDVQAPGEGDINSSAAMLAQMSVAGGMK